ncbi:MAG: HDOD domain-containing protein [Planctomycetota bacterium]
MKPAQDLFEVIERMPPLPDVAVQVLGIVSDPEYSLDGLVSVVRTDPTLTARILKTCNSSLYSLNREVSSVSEAVSFLGTRNLVKLVVATCTSSYFKHAGSSTYLSPKEIWRHSIACGITCQILAERSGLDEASTAFTAGILHNIGKIAISQFMESYQPNPEALEIMEDGDFLAFERSFCSMDHAVAGSLVLDRWLLPTQLRRAIRNHHDENLIPADPELTSIVHIADILCLQEGIGIAHEGLSYEISPLAMQRLGMSEKSLEMTRSRLQKELERSGELIKFV